MSEANPNEAFSFSTSSEDSVDSADWNEQGCAVVGSPQCNTAHRKKKGRKIRNKAHLEWINSWPKGVGIEVRPNGRMRYCVCTDGYFRRGRGGGHGVIIRDTDGNPIVASAMVAEQIVSCRYHQLEGVARGIELAIEYSLLDIELFCNAKHVARLVNLVLQTKRGCFIHENSIDVICTECVKYYAEEDWLYVLPLLQKIARMITNLYPPFMIQKCSRALNSAANYLAKNGAPEKEVLWPSEFPTDFKKILCQDYFGSEPHGLPFFM